jgi:STE24 endopeptidase
MTEQSLYIIIVVIIVADFLLERVLAFLNHRSSKKEIPESLAGIYDPVQYAKSQQYQGAIERFSWVSASISFVILLLAILLGWFGALDAWVRNFSPLEYTTPLIFFGILYVISDVLGTPFDLYRTFVIEEKFGFNKMTVKTYLLDKLKSYLLTTIIGGLLLTVFLVLFIFLGKDFWLYFWGVAAVFMLLANLLYTSWIIPLFNKLTPLTDGKLKQSIQTFCEKVQFPLTNIFVIDGSKRSAKGNAFFSGFGKKKKVVLYDTLIEKHTVEELTAVFAHEVGHYKKRHIIFSTLLSLLQMGLILFLLSRMIQNSEISYAMGGNITAIHLNMLAFGILISPLSHLLGLLMNYFSRKNEFEADAYAVKNYGAEPLVNALKKLSSDHLSNLTPHPAYVFVHYSHPPLAQRVDAMQKINEN